MDGRASPPRNSFENIFPDAKRCESSPMRARPHPVAVTATPIALAMGASFAGSKELEGHVMTDTNGDALTRHA